MKKLAYAVVAAGLAGVSGLVMAAEESSPHSLTGNLGFFSDYRHLLPVALESYMAGGWNIGHGSENSVLPQMADR